VRSKWLADMLVFVFPAVIAFSEEEPSLFLDTQSWKTCYVCMIDVPNLAMSILEYPSWRF